MRLKLLVSVLCVISLLAGTTGLALAVIGAIDTNDGLLDTGWAGATGYTNPAPTINTELLQAWTAFNPNGGGGANPEIAIRIDTLNDPSTAQGYYGAIFDCNNDNILGDGPGVSGDLAFFYDPLADNVALATYDIPSDTYTISGNVSPASFGEVLSVPQPTVEMKMDQATLDGLVVNGWANCFGSNHLMKFVVLDSSGVLADPSNISPQFTFDLPTAVTLASFKQQTAAPWLALLSGGLVLVGGFLAFWLKRQKASMRQ